MQRVRLAACGPIKPSSSSGNSQKHGEPIRSGCEEAAAPCERCCNRLDILTPTNRKPHRGEEAEASSSSLLSCPHKASSLICRQETAEKTEGTKGQGGQKGHLQRDLTVF